MKIKGDLGKLLFMVKSWLGLGSGQLVGLGLFIRDVLTWRKISGYQTLVDSGVGPSPSGLNIPIRLFSSVLSQNHHIGSNSDH